MGNITLAVGAVVVPNQPVILTVENIDCGTGTNGTVAQVNSVSINGVSKTDSAFPLTFGETGGPFSLTSEVNYGTGNTIQVNIQGIPVEGYEQSPRLKIFRNGTTVYSSAISGPFPTATGIIMNSGDEILVSVGCYAVQ